MIFVSFSYVLKGIVYFNNDIMQELSIETVDDIRRIQKRIEELYEITSVIILNWKIL